MNHLESAYRAGRIACADGKPKSANPHPLEAEEHGYWNRGWNEEFKTLPHTLQAARQAKDESHANE